MSSASQQHSSFASAHLALKRAQKGGRGAPPYSLFVNRPLGRILAAWALVSGLRPNQVTVLSAVFTFLGLGLVALAPPTVLIGVAVTACLVLGYALDSADGQLARLRGGGTLLGEWLDHMIDAVKVSAVHLAVLIGLYRQHLLDERWLLVPLLFCVVSAVHFFGMILVDLLARSRRALAGLPAASPEPANLVTTLLKLPTDYGVLCLVFLLWGAPTVFFVVYTFLALANTGYTVLVAAKWARDVVALDELGHRSAAVAEAGAR